MAKSGQVGTSGQDTMKNINTVNIKEINVSKQAKRSPPHAHLIEVERTVRDAVAQLVEELLPHLHTAEPLEHLVVLGPIRHGRGGKNGNNRLSINAGDAWIGFDWIRCVVRSSDHTWKTKAASKKTKTPTRNLLLSQQPSRHQSSDNTHKKETEEAVRYSREAGGLFHHRVEDDQLSVDRLTVALRVVPELRLLSLEGLGNLIL